ncbi:MAG: 3'-5' exonuclease, partial [Gemmatimonadetes bacterium]|nr:3'-5' exonuclease [Gemmatimonadota bacterium]
MIGPGLRFRETSPIRDRAARLLAAGALTSDMLAARLFGIRRAPRWLADRLVGEALAGDPGFRIDSAGLWRYRPPTPLLPPLALDRASFCVVDFETTGGNPWNGHRVTEIGAVKVREGRAVDRFVTLVNPERAIPPFVRRLTGITDDMVAVAPRFAEVLAALQSFVSGTIFVAHNAAFDWKFLDAESRRASGLRLEGTRLCTLRLARRLVPELDRRSLDALAWHFGVSVGSRHRAGDDAQATALIFLRLLERLRERGVRDLSGLQEYLRSRDGVRGVRGVR